MEQPKIRVFEDLTNLEIYMMDAKLADNEHDVIQSFEVNGTPINLIVSGSILHHLEIMRVDAMRTWDYGKGFRSEEVMQEKRDMLNAEQQQIRKAVVGTLYDLWRKATQ